ncbi:MAG: right-handed parallel beta-helix repeat-containing protein [Pseudomonadota bacterium]
MLKRALSATCMAMLALSASVQAAVFTVDRADDDGSASACTEAPLDCSLRGALQTANIALGPDEIVLAAGTFSLTQNTGSADALPVSSEVTIRGMDIDQTFVVAGAGFPGSALVVNAGGALTLEDLTLSGFEPDPAQSPAGALHVTGAIGANALLRRVRIENSRGQSGGGVLVSQSDGGLEPEFRLQLFDSIISGNRAVANLPNQECDGAGLALLNGRIMIDNTVITENVTEFPATGGGGICIDRAMEVMLNSSTVSDNTSVYTGGGIHSEQTVLRVDGTTIESNDVPNTQFGRGGGMFIRGGVAFVADSELINNTNLTELGAEVFGSGPFSLVVVRSLIRNTVATNSGLYLENAERLEFAGTTFSGRGATVFAFESTVIATQVDMFPSLGRISALWLVDSTLTADRLVIQGIRTNGVSRGGALLIFRGSASINDCEFAFHGAEVSSGLGESGAGGAVYASGADLTMSRCSFYRNVAEVSGGAIALRDESVLTLTNSTFSNNRANGGEGLSVIGNSQVTLENVTFAAPNDADQIQIFGASGTIGNSAIEGTCSLFASGGDTDSLGNVVTDSSCQVQNAGDLVVPDLLVHPLAENGSGSPSHLPRLNSPLRGFAMNCPDEDQRGELRGEPCDAGAIERVITDNNLFMDSFEG